MCLDLFSYYFDLALFKSIDDDDHNNKFKSFFFSFLLNLSHQSCKNNIVFVDLQAIYRMEFTKKPSWIKPCILETLKPWGAIILVNC